MPVQELLNVSYHQQDEEDWCGAGCAQMEVDYMGGGVQGQSGLYKDLHGHSTQEAGFVWNTGPDGLAWTLNDRKPADSPHAFRILAMSSASEISRALVWSMYEHGIAPVALVYGYGHWLVVRGYELDRRPRGPDDKSFSIRAFTINDPAPPLSTRGRLGLPPPHGDRDGCPGRGGAAVHVSYQAWRQIYVGSPVPKGQWKGQYLVVSEAPSPPTQPRRTPAPPSRGESDRLIQPDQVVAFASAGLETYGLLAREPWKRGLEDARPGKPMLVDRLDAAGARYWLIPMLDEERVVRAHVAIDAQSGAYLQTSLRSALPWTGAEAWLDPDALREHLRGRGIEDLDEDGSSGGRKALGVGPYVWRPCRQSRSPDLVFRTIRIGQQTLYLRGDGRVFDKLVPLGAG